MVTIPIVMRKETVWDGDNLCVGELEYVVNVTGTVGKKWVQRLSVGSDARISATDAINLLHGPSSLTGVDSDDEPTSGVTSHPLVLQQQYRFLFEPHTAQVKDVSTMGSNSVLSLLEQSGLSQYSRGQPMLL